MRVSNLLAALSIFVAVLAVFASVVGLVYQDNGSSFSFTTVRGETVQVYGQGMYRYEVLRDGIGFKGADLYVLVVAVPLLLLSVMLARRGSLRGGLVLTGTLAYFLYNAVSMTFGYAYNNLFLVYTALLTASLFATVLAFASSDLSALPARFTEKMPRRGLAAFLFVVGISLVLVWGGLDILPALLAGTAPALVGHTTLPTHAMDMGIIATASFVAGVLLLKRAPFGYLLASVLVILSAVLGAGVLALSAAQVLSGVLTFAQTIAFVVPFVILTVVALWLTAVTLRSLEGTVQYPSSKQGTGQVQVVSR
jgi:hypothetical protein